jgi:hypothetical protein
VDLTRYVDELRHELLLAAEAGGEDARLLAERLVAPLQSTTRLVLLDALSAAAGEITSDLAPGSVEVRLRGREPEFVVTSPATESPDADDDPAVALGSRPGLSAPAGWPDTAGESDTSGAGAAMADVDDGGTVRVTLRLPEPLKQRIEDAAGRDGLSVNAWLVRTLSGVVEPTQLRVGSTRRSSSGGERFTGWARS